MHLMRERPFMPAFLSPAPLPSLRDALARRAAIFGPVEVYEMPVTPRRSWPVIGAALRHMVDALDPVRVP